MSETWVEPECVVAHEGRSFESGGAYVSDDHLVAYTSEGGVLTDWHGNPIGAWRATSTWKTPRCWVSSTMSQIEARLSDGRRYTGRGAGVGMLYRGKRKAGTS